MASITEILTFSNETLRNTVIAWAQIVTAVGTVGATIAAVVLGSRPHRQLLKLTFGKQIRLFLGGPHANMHISGITFNVINAGLLPVPIRSVEFFVHTDDGVKQIPINTATGSGLPVTLNYGEQHQSSIEFEDDDWLWMGSVAIFRIWRRPAVRVSTGTGKQLVFRFPVRLMRQIYMANNPGRKK